MWNIAIWDDYLMFMAEPVLEGTDIDIKVWKEICTFAEFKATVSFVFASV